MQIAQINIARMLEPLDHPSMSDFVNNLDRINGLAENSEGFIWRLKDEETDDATSINVFGDDYLVINMSVWKDIDSLFAFTYHSDHVEIFKRRKEWFGKMKDMHMAVWYIEDGQFPTDLDGKHRIEYIREHGETPYAFTFRNKYTEEDLKHFAS